MTHSLSRKGFVRLQLSELVINWHITEACNYRCRYCYAHWEGSGRELVHNAEASERLLQKLWHFFRPTNKANPLRRHMDWQGVRLNLAGGEPLLYPDRVSQIIQAASEIGFATSLITNGSAFSTALAKRLAPHLFMLGISLDSGLALTNQEIGRHDRNGNLLQFGQLEEAIKEAQCCNPRLRFKLNTVVNARNCQENLSTLVWRLSPERWKVLRMLPVVTNDLAISDADFHCFVARHQCLGSILCVEDNAEMADSYVMIDPHGRFFQNVLGRSSYRYSLPIPDVGVEAAFAAASMDPVKFCARYLGNEMKVAA